MADDIQDVKDALEALGCRPQGTDKIKAKCPAHQDDKPSLSAAVIDGRLLLTCFAGCRWDDIFGYLAPLLPTPDKINIEKEVLAVYPYHYPSGEHAYDKIKFVDKSFKFHSTVGGKEFWSRGGIPPLAYNLPDVIHKIGQNKIIVFTEGEKDCETLGRWDITATTAGGVKNATDQFWDENLVYFMNARIALVYDADQPGIDFINAVGERLFRVASSLKIIDLPGLPMGSGKDISDWVISHPKEEFVELALRAPDWTKPKTYYELLDENKRLRAKLGLTSDAEVV